MKKHPLLLLITGLTLILGVLVFMVYAQEDAVIDNDNKDLAGGNGGVTNAATETQEDPAITEVEVGIVESPENKPLPATAKLNVPFTSQAPHGKWDLPYKEACEEASVLMAARFLQGRTIDGPDDADTAIIELTGYVDTEMGLPIDMTAAQTAELVERFYGFETEVLYEFSWDDIKQAIANGYPVLVPAAGKQLGNPNFTAPGPPYHMLVVIGYTEDKVITNDPGTRNGANYEYDFDTFYNAIHDWNDGDVDNGQKVIIIVKPSS